MKFLKFDKIRGGRLCGILWLVVVEFEVKSFVLDFMILILY